LYSRCPSGKALNPLFSPSREELMEIAETIKKVIQELIVLSSTSSKLRIER